MNILTSRYRQAELNIAAQQAIDRALVESVDIQPATVTQATLPGDTRRLRGIPAIGRGVTGATNGTNPVAHLLRTCT